MKKKLIKEQLIRSIDKTKEKHDALKLEVNHMLDEMLELEKKINKKIKEIEETEKKYVELVELYSK